MYRVRYKSLWLTNGCLTGATNGRTLNGAHWAWFVRIFNHYHRRSVGAWGKQQEDPSFENLRLLAKYQANEIRNPDETTYKRVVRTAKRLGLTLRPKNNRTSESF